MKIGILTQPLHNNYGGLLQNYALQQILIRLGHKVETIDHGSPEPSFIHHFLADKTAEFLSKVLRLKTKVNNYYPTCEEQAVINQHTQYFIDKYILHTPVYTSKQNFRIDITSNQYDAYVVGSDQCWRPKYNRLWIEEMFLGFAEKQDAIKRIAYAASFGTSDWEYSQELTKICSNLVKKFDFVSVREVSGVNLCKDYLGVDAVQVLDPTMLLKREDYEKIVKEEKEPQSKGSLFHYILDPSDEKRSFIQNVANKHNLSPFTIMPKYQKGNRTRLDVKTHMEDCIFPSVTCWLRGFMDAKMVIVDSFHGAVFAIIFNKPFWVIGNSKRGNARFESLLDMFELKDRMITPEDVVDWGKRINWKRVNEIRVRELNRSVNLLKKSLTK